MGNWIVKGLKYLKECTLEVFSGDNGSCMLCGESGDGSLTHPLKNEPENRPLTLCSKCMSKIKLCMDYTNIDIMGRSFKCYSAAYYSGGMKELVLKLKYKSDFRAGECIAHYMKELIAREKLCFDAAACVPSGHSAYKKRGYNQSHVLAAKLGNLLDVPVMDPLIKIKESKDQIGLDEASRWRNMEGSFKVRDMRQIFGKRILLIDDVVTTGATAFCSACALSDAGAAEVTILTAAKSRL